MDVKDKKLRALASHPQMFKDLTYEEYCNFPGLRSSNLKAANKSINHYLSELDSPSQPSRSMICGTVVHLGVLEPSIFHQSIIVEPKVDRRTKSGREEYREFLESAGERIVLSTEENIKCQQMIKAIDSHPQVSSLFEGGSSEVSIFWTDPDTDLSCKARIDHIHKIGLVDLKTARDASIHNFSSSIANLDYHISAAFYFDGYTQVFGREPDNFIFVAVENSPPFNVGWYRLDDEDLELGRAEYKKGLFDIKRWETDRDRTGIEPYGGYPLEVQSINLPPWRHLRSKVVI